MICISHVCRSLHKSGSGWGSRYSSLVTNRPSVAPAGSWLAGSWLAGSWLAGSWLAGSWVAGSWVAGSWVAGSWLMSVAAFEAFVSVPLILMVPSVSC